MTIGQFEKAGAAIGSGIGCAIGSIGLAFGPYVGCISASCD